MDASDGERVAVLVVGAGPAGLVLACELARRRAAVRVVDRLTSRPRSHARSWCTLAVWR